MLRPERVHIEIHFCIYLNLSISNPKVVPGLEHNVDCIGASDTAKSPSFALNLTRPCLVYPSRSWWWWWWRPADQRAKEPGRRSLRHRKASCWLLHLHQCWLLHLHQCWLLHKLNLTSAPNNLTNTLLCLEVAFSLAMHWRDRFVFPSLPSCYFFASTDPIQ